MKAYPIELIGKGEIHKTPENMSSERARIKRMAIPTRIKYLLRLIDDSDIDLHLLGSFLPEFFKLELTCIRQANKKPGISDSDLIKTATELYKLKK
jgi:hypothetical protein